jgi:prepilin-type N-terminal cleavage/methylation domain-containing protein
MLCKRATRGFSLIELMAVVTIIGVLAIIATVAYKRWVRSAHVHEGTNMLIGIRVAQDNYFKETGQYMDVSASFNDVDAYPAPMQSVGQDLRKTAWGSACGAHCNANAAGSGDWAKLGAQPDGPVFFGYLTRADSNVGPQAKGVPNFSPDYPNYATQLDSVWSANKGPWYVAVGRADFDSDGTPVEVAGSSYNNEIVVNHEGE